MGLSLKHSKCEHLAAVSCSPNRCPLGGAGLVSGTTGKLGHAWVVALLVHGMVHGCMVMWCWGVHNTPFMNPPHHHAPCNAPTHAPPMHRPLHGPACPSSQTPIPPHLTGTQLDFMILLLFFWIILEFFITCVFEIILIMIPFTFMYSSSHGGLEVEWRLCIQLKANVIPWWIEFSLWLLYI